MTAQLALFRDGDRAEPDGPASLRVGSSAAITEGRLRRPKCAKVPDRWPESTFEMADGTFVREADMVPALTDRTLPRRITEESVRRALDCGVPLLVREVWARVGADGPEDAAAVADALLRLEASGRARCDLETMRWEAT